jgi:hypothetical protein
MSEFPAQFHESLWSLQAKVFLRTKQKRLLASNKLLACGVNFDAVAVQLDNLWLQRIVGTCQLGFSFVVWLNLDGDVWSFYFC